MPLIPAKLQHLCQRQTKKILIFGCVKVNKEAPDRLNEGIYFPPCLSDFSRPMTLNSVRLFLALFSGVSFGTLGIVSP